MNVFITGITGTLGTALARRHFDLGDGVRGCARNEARVVEHRAMHPWGDGIVCADAVRLDELLGSAERVYHCAAMKHVEHCEEVPSEAVQENLTVLQAVIDACSDAKTDLVFISSDKACDPVGVYGATKLIGEALALKADFTVVRLGNLLGSSGSVFRKWNEAHARGEPALLTSPDATRFFIPVSEAAWILTRVSPGTRAFIPKMKAIRMGTAALLWPNRKEIGLRPGERLFEYADERSRSDEAPQWSLNEFYDALEAEGCTPPISPYSLVCS